MKVEGRVWFKYCTSCDYEVEVMTDDEARNPTRVGRG